MKTQAVTDTQAENALSNKNKQSMLLYGFPRNTEITEKKVDVDDALSRLIMPGDATEMKIDVFGVYALPEAWKTKIVSY